MSNIDEILSQFTIAHSEVRPWGTFHVIAESSAPSFAARYFGVISAPYQAKILVVNAGARLSWQYHHRRQELWHVLAGPVGIMRSNNDTIPEIEIIPANNRVTIEAMERHRLCGLDNNAIVAEIWCHINPNHPSDEADIVRVADDYQR